MRDRISHRGSFWLCILYLRYETIVNDVRGREITSICYQESSGRNCHDCNQESPKLTLGDRGASRQTLYHGLGTLIAIAMPASGALAVIAQPSTSCGSPLVRWCQSKATFTCWRTVHGMCLPLVTLGVAQLHVLHCYQRLEDGACPARRNLLNRLAAPTSTCRRLTSDGAS